MKKSEVNSNKRHITVIGWQERVKLPKLKLKNVRAKIDTGARTSALHVENISRFEKDGEDWVKFQPVLRSDRHFPAIECPIHDIRSIKNTGGVPEERIIIRTPFVIASRRWSIDISLADRTNMTFPMLVGRLAFKGRSIAVHPRRTFLVSHP